MAENLAFTFLWKIENFDFAVLRKFHDGLQSRVFFVDSLEKSRWRLKLFSNGVDGSNRFILLCARVPKSIKVVYELSFLGPSKCVSHVTPKVSMTISNPLGTLIENCPTQQEVFVTKRSVFLPQNTLTLQLKLWKTSYAVEKAGQCCSRTELTSREYRRCFNIENFSNFQLGQDKVIAGYTATSCIRRPTDFTDVMMNIHMKGETTQRAAVDVKVTPYLPFSHFPLSCKLAVMDVFGKLVICEQDLESSVSKRWAGKWEFTKFFTRQEIMDKKSNLLSGNCLLLSCDIVVLEIRDEEMTNDHPEFRLDEGSPDCETSMTQPADETLAPTLLQDDLLSLYKKKTFCDFELRAGDVSFPVHKAILGTRSPVFNALFTSDMKEAPSGVLVIPDVDADTLERMLEYVYTDTVSVLRKDRAAKLYYASDKYLLPALKRKCTSYLRTHIDLSNICEVLELAHRHCDDDLKSAAHKFLIQNMDKTVRSPEWREFMAQNVQLAAEIMHELFSKVEIKKE